MGKKKPPWQFAKLKIYTFVNEHHNYCKGEYQFIAHNLEEARKMALEFGSRTHRLPDAYRVLLTFRRFCYIKPGYLPLDRS